MADTDFNWDGIFPKLFCTKNGKTRMWLCWVEENKVYRTDGFVGGKMKEPLFHTFQANTLRTANEQAYNEAEKMWIRQTGKDYRPAQADENGMKIYSHVCSQKTANGGMIRGVKMFESTKITTETTAGQQSGEQHRPMLAKKYKEGYDLSPQGRQLQFPVIIQPKLDGIRALAYMDSTGNSVILESRNGKNFMWLDHIRDDIKKILTSKAGKGLILDGEIYAHRIVKNGKCLDGVSRFQFISEVCKVTRSRPHAEEKLVNYVVFDCWDMENSCDDRISRVDRLVKHNNVSHVQLVPYVYAPDHETIEKCLEHYVADSYEGIMIRDPKSQYKASTTHSNCLLKYKKFEDEEWEIYGAETCVGGNCDGAVKWLCKKVIDGKTVNLVAKQMGSNEESKRIYNQYKKRPERFNGKMVNIRFNERTKDGVPRFPRATAIVLDK